MGLVAAVNPETRFIVYSRGTGSSGKGWQDEDYRLEWVDGLARRFPALKNHVTTIAIDGGVQKGSFKNPIVAAQMRSVLTSILGQAATD